MLPAALQYAVAVVLQAAVAIAFGATLSSFWLPPGSSARAALRRWMLAAALGALAMHAVLLWLQAAAMAEVPLAEAGPAVRNVLSGTHYGLAWCIGAGALLAVAALGLLQRLADRPPNALILAAIALFLYTRSMVSHAAGAGDLSLAMLADWLHLLLVSTWVGTVFATLLAVLPRLGQANAATPPEPARFVASLSATAAIAVAGIVLTGMFAAWRQLGTPANALGNPYGNLLLAKVALVLASATLGGINRWLVMPGLAASDSRQARRALARFQLVLRIEAAVLLAVLLLAVALGATSPPTA
jgi:putative copper resistance protein D